MVQEVELKLILAPRDRDFLQTHPILNQESAKATRLNLSNQYFDTPDQQLTKAGIALRIRSFGDHWVQTVKGKGRNVAGLHQRLELEWPLDKPELDLGLIPEDLWPKGVQLEDIAPLFTTDFSRDLRVINTNNGTEIEVVIDEGHAIAGDRHDPICEVELELKSGDAYQLFDVALDLAKDCPLVPSDVSKAERGYRLVNNNYNVLADLPEIDANQSIETGFEQVMAYELESLQRQWEAFHYSENWTHLHSFRNTLGNIRTNFLLFRDMLTLEGTAGAIESLDWIEQQLTPILNWWPACYVLSKHASEEPRSASEQLQQAKAMQALEQLAELERQPKFGYNILLLSRWLHKREWTNHHTDQTLHKAQSKMGQAMLEPLRQQWMALHLSDCGGNASSWLEKQPMIQGLTHICQTLESIFGTEMKTMRLELELLEDNLVELSAMDVVDKMGDWIQDLTQNEKQSINSWARSQTVIMREMNLHAQKFLQTISTNMSH